MKKEFNLEKMFKTAEELSKTTAELMKEFELWKESLEEPVKTYPVGYDPNGEWYICLHIKSGKYAVGSSNDGEICEFYHILGWRFTTEQQAQQRADGLNAMKELVFAIHEENGKARGEKRLSFFVNAYNVLDIGDSKVYDSLIMKSGVQCRIIEKLGDEKIKTALLYGV